MNEILNTLYVQTQGALLQLDHDTVRVVVEGETRLRVPLIRLSSIVIFGQVSVTPFLIHRCADDGRPIVWLDYTGRYRAKIEGRTKGNVLLRRAQHLALSDPTRTCGLAKQLVAGKIRNSRSLLQRAARDSNDLMTRDELTQASDRLLLILQQLQGASTVDQVRGLEGEAGRNYFAAFRHVIRNEQSEFVFMGRTRRPPLDRTNCVLSFLYSLLRTECISALEGVGLDPQIGYLHSLRPGRPALALDLMEELRPIFADRLALNLINRQQLKVGHFEITPGGAVLLNEEGRREVLVAYQKRKEMQVSHRLLGQKVPLGLLPHVQARLLARYLRGDMEDYIPFTVS